MKDRDLILHRMCDIGNSAKSIYSLCNRSLIGFDVLGGESTVQLTDSGFRSIFPDYNAEKHDPNFRWEVNVVVDGVIFFCACSDLEEVYGEE